MKRITITRCAFAFVIALNLFVVVSKAQSGSETVIPLEGLDPVMLSQGKEVQGDMKYTVKRGQFQYLFANAESKATFEKEPCALRDPVEWPLRAHGSANTGNPDLYTVHNGRIYIFGSEECQTLFKATPEKYLEVPAPPRTPPSAEMVKRGQALIAKAVEAFGGAKLDQLASIQRKDVRGNEVKSTLLLAFPDAIRQETVRPTFTLVSVVTPSDSFFLVNNRANSMPEANRAAITNELNRELFVLLRARTRPDFKSRATPWQKRRKNRVDG